MDKSKLSETDICEKFISPALMAAGWDIHEQILREYPLRPGRMVVRGKHASRDKKSVLRADYVLFWKANIPLAVIEAKDNTQAVGAGMQQALGYAELLNVPFIFSSNGDGFVFRDVTLATGTLEANLDDLSYVRRDQAETSVLFELIAERYERKSLAITANTPFSQWGDVFAEPAMTLATVDRVVHHSVILEMNVESYRRRAAQSGHARTARKER